jgi:hypothetical protein
MCCHLITLLLQYELLEATAVHTSENVNYGCNDDRQPTSSKKFLTYPLVFPEL